VDVDLRRGDEHSHRDEAAHDRRPEQRAILEFDPRNAPGALPRRERHEDERDRPGEVEVRALHVRPHSRLVQVDPVADRVEYQAGCDERPGSPGLPPGHREDEDEEGEQEHVADPIGDVRQHDQAAAVRGVDHDLDEDRRCERGGSGRGDEAVEPEARAEGGNALAEEQDDADVEERVEGEIADVGGRREGRTARAPRARGGVPQLP
jgi:hypothetical protein